MTQILLAASLLLASLGANPGARVDVTPNPWSGRVHLEAVSKTGGHAIQAQSPSKHAEPPCDQGPGARAIHLSCGTINFPGTFSPGEPDDAVDIERAVREIPMPALRARVQPTGEVLVNIPTIFYTEPRTLRRTVTLLGHHVHVIARPVGYTWHHGDGTT